MLDGSERADGVAHLGVFRIPVDFRVGKVIQDLVSASFLSVVNEWHSVERVGKHSEGVTVVAVHFEQGLAPIVEVQVVVGDIQHTPEIYAP